MVHHNSGDNPLRYSTRVRSYRMMLQARAVAARYTPRHGWFLIAPSFGFLKGLMIGFTTLYYSDIY